MRNVHRPVYLVASLVAVGFVSMTGQLLLARELTATFFGNELVLGLILSSWLVWVAAGAWGLARLTKRVNRAALAWAWLGTGVLLPVQMILIRASRSLLGMTPGALVPLGPLTLIVWISLAPLCVLVGWQFTVSARLLSADRVGPGTAYVVESVGAVVGGLLFTFLLAGRLQPLHTALFLGGVDLAVAAQVVCRRRLLWTAGAVLWLAVAWPAGTWLHRATLGVQYPGVRSARDSIYGRIVVTGSGTQRVFYENGALYFETQGTTGEEAAHLPLLAHPNPERVLLIGGGVSGTLVEILRHPTVREVHYLELDPELIAAARQELPAAQAAVLDDERVTLIHVDGRIYVRSLQEQAPDLFDVLILDLPEPATGLLNRFYTQEFFAEARSVLATDGILALHLPWQENYPGPARQRLGASVYRTLETVFPHLLLLPGEVLTIVASSAPAAHEPWTWSQRLAERGIATRWIVPAYLDYLLADDRQARAESLLQAHPDVRLNRDLEPICYFYDLMIWLARFYHDPVAGRSQSALLRLWPYLSLPLLAVGALLLRRRAVPAAVALVGFAEMATEMTILFTFQAARGYVYGHMGLVAAAFMGGLALGAGASGRWLEPAAQSAGPHALRSSRGTRPRKVLMWAQVGIVGLAFLLWGTAGWDLGAAVLPALALAAGGLAGSVFPAAVACASGRTPRTDSPAGLMYAADLVGGCFGSALTGVVLIPLLGIPRTCLTVGLVGAVGLLVLL